MLFDWTDACYNYMKKKKPHIDVLGKNKVEEGEKERKKKKRKKRGVGGGMRKKKNGGK